MCEGLLKLCACLLQVATLLLTSSANMKNLLPVRTGPDLLSVRAGMVLAEKEKPVSWQWKEVIKNDSATSWEFVHVGSQHRNGLSEAQVKVLKKSLNLAITPGTILKYSELVTLRAKISHSVNSRPLCLSSTSQDSQQEDFLQPVTPNQLLLGRTDDEAQPL